MAATPADDFHRVVRRRPALHPVGAVGGGLWLESTSRSSAPEFRGHPGRLPVVGHVPLAAISGGRPGLGAKVGLGGLGSFRSLAGDADVGVSCLVSRHVPRAGLTGQRWLASRGGKDRVSLPL